MNIVRIIGLSFVILLFFSCSDKSGIEVFQDININSETKLLALKNSQSIHPFPDKMGDFIIDNQDALHRMKSEWYFELRKEKAKCEHNYDVFIFNGKIPVENFQINLQCTELSCKYGDLYFPKNQLIDFEKDMKQVRGFMLRSSEKEEIEQIQKLLNMHDNVLIPKEIDYDFGKWELVVYGIKKYDLEKIIFDNSFSILLKEI